MSEQEDQIVQKVKQEKDLHKQNKEEEVKRHKQKMRQIKDEAEIGELIDLQQEIEENEEQRRELRDNIKDKLYSISYQMTSRQRTTVGTQITIREDSIYMYDSSDEAPLGKIIRQPELVQKGIDDDKDAEKFKEIVDQIKDVKERTKTHYRNRAKILHSSMPTEAKKGDKNMVGYTTASTTDAVLYKQGSNTGLHSRHSVSYSNKYKIGTDSEDTLEYIVTYREEIKSVMKDVKTLQESSIQTRQEALNTITEEGSTYLVQKQL